MSLTKKNAVEKKNGNGSSLFPSFRNDFFNNRFFLPRLFDFDEDTWGKGMNTPLVNISETEKEFRLDVSAPGLKKEDFKIDVDNGVLTISSEKEEEKTDNDKNYHRKEFSYASFARTFRLPENVDEDNVNARYENGMLEVIVPKKEMTASKTKKQINVE